MDQMRQKHYKPPTDDNKPEIECEEDLGAGIVEGRSAVMELLRSERGIDKIFVANDATGSINHIVKSARERGVAVISCDRRKLDAVSITHAHQGIIAYASAIEYSEISEMLEIAETRSEQPLLIICDGITDPHNLGAIIRSAEVSGAHGVIIPKRRSASVNAACVKASAGAVEFIKIARVSNLASAIRDLKKEGIWVFGTDASGDTTLYNADFKVPAAFVIGSEGQGMARITKESCDYVISIPIKGKISSLNASAAASVILFEALRQRAKI